MTGTALRTNGERRGKTHMGADMDTSSGADLQRVVEELARRVERLEFEVAEARARPTPLPADTVVVIAAAVAAYLGKRATIRQIHVAAGRAWAQQGRASVQASHNISHASRGGHAPHGSQ